MNDPTQTIVDTLAAIVPAFDQRVTPHPDGPFYRVDGSPISSTLRRPAGNPLVRDTYSVVAVNNNPAGARLLARRAFGVLDGLVIDGYRLTHDYSGPVLEDDADTSNYRWSCTVVFHLTQPRSS